MDQLQEVVNAKALLGDSYPFSRISLDRISWHHQIQRYAVMQSVVLYQDERLAEARKLN